MTEKLYIVRGPIGVGKTSVIQALLKQMPDHASVIEVDGIKRMLDPTASSEWRRKIAHASASFIIDKLLKMPRSAIVETDTKYPEEVEQLVTVADNLDLPTVSVLLTAPLQICLARAATREVNGISYDIDAAMVENSYCNLEPRPEDFVFDTNDSLPDEIADVLLHACSHDF